MPEAIEPPDEHEQMLADAGLDSDVEQSKRDKARANRGRIRDQLVAQGLKECVSTRQGRAFLNAIVAECGVYRTSFTSNNSAVFFNEGRRNVGLFLHAMLLKAHPDELLTMMKESNYDNG